MNVQGIIKPLELISGRGYNPRQVFEDWVALMFWSLQRNDDEYLKIVQRYRNDRPQGEREIDHFCRAFGLLMQEMSESNAELLGEIYMQWEVMNHYTGQFFTPFHVALMMAQMMELGSEQKAESSEHSGSGFEHYIGDPCCGAGIMFVAACKTMTNEQVDQSLFVGQDIDFTCVMMCCLNLTFFNMNGYVILGNSLSLETRRAFRTTRSYLGGSICEVPVEEVTPFVGHLMKKEVAPIEPKAPKLMQQSFF